VLSSAIESQFGEEAKEDIITRMIKKRMMLKSIF